MKDKFLQLFLTVAFLVFSLNAQGKEKTGISIRVPSDYPEVTRIVGALDVEYLKSNEGATATLVSRSCLLTAAHAAAKSSALFGVVRKDSFKNDENVYKFANIEISDGYYDGVHAWHDWAVIRLKPNTITGKFAGDVQGYMSVSIKSVAKKQRVRITGHGDSQYGRIQQTALGSMTYVGNGEVCHNVDTAQGNSGSGIVDIKSGEIIGIHTHVGDGGKCGMPISDAIIEAINRCRAIDD